MSLYGVIGWNYFFLGEFTRPKVKQAEDNNSEAAGFYYYFFLSTAA